MLTPHYGFDAGKVAGNGLNASEWDYLVRVVDTQLPGAMRALGTGVIVTDILNAGAATDLKVSSLGYSVEVGAGHAVYNEQTNGYGYGVAGFRTAQSVSITGLQDGENFVYLTPAFASAPNDLDTRQGDEPQITFSIIEADELGDGSLLLAQITIAGGQISEVVDRRKFMSFAALALRIVQIETDIGYDDNERAKGSVTERLNELTGDEGGAAAITFLSQLKFSDSDTRNAITVIEEMIQSAIDGQTTEETVPMQLPEDRLGEAIMHTRDGVIKLSPSVADAIEAAELVIGFAGHAADGSPPPAAAINDTENVLLYSTLQVDTPNREMTP